MGYLRKCKKKAFIFDTVIAADTTKLIDCAEALASDAKVAKAVAKLDADIGKKCTGADLGPAFPGRCADREDFTVCIGERVQCRLCLMWSEMDDLSTDCDSVDDGVANESCAAD